MSRAILIGLLLALGACRPVALAAPAPTQPAVYVDGGTPYGAVTLFYASGRKKGEGSYEGWTPSPKNNERVPRPSGHWIFWFENGQKMEEGNYVGGEPDGLWLEWDAQGSKVGESRFHAGARDGVSLRLSADGKVVTRTEWRAGKKDGAEIVYFPTGKPAMEAHYRAGEPVGTWTNWNSEGRLTKTQVFKNGQLQP